MCLGIIRVGDRTCRFGLDHKALQGWLVGGFDTLRLGLGWCFGFSSPRLQCCRQQYVAMCPVLVRPDCCLPCRGSDSRQPRRKSARSRHCKTRERVSTCTRQISTQHPGRGAASCQIWSDPLAGPLDGKDEAHPDGFGRL